MILKKRIVPLLLSVAVALSFSMIGAEVGLAADSVKSSVKPIANAAFQGASIDTKAFTAKEYPVKRIKAGSTAYLPFKTIAVISHGSSSASKTTWLKIRPVASGFIKTSSDNMATMQLCNSKKKALSPARKVSTSYTSAALRDVNFGVKAKTTYYLKLRSPGVYDSDLGEYANYAMVINYKCTGKYGKTARKAAKLTRGKPREGFLQSTSKAKYYKITKRGKTLDILFASCTDGKFKVTLTVTAPNTKTYKKTFTLTRYNAKRSIPLYLTSGKTRNMKCIIKVSRVGSSSGGFGMKYK